MTTLTLTPVLAGQTIPPFTVTVNAEGGGAANLTGYETKAQFRTNPASAVALDYSSAAASISITGGVLTFGEKTAPTTPGTYTADVFLIAPDGDKTPIVRLLRQVNAAYTKV